MLLASALLHLVIIALLIGHLRKKDHFANHRTGNYKFLMLCAVILTIIGSHTLQIYLNATVLWLMGALPDYAISIYYTLVTYTTTGYGDVVLDSEFHVMGAMISVTGIVMFGVTTAFLVDLFSRLMGENTS
ncbi:MAG: ion channel [Pseudomonadota bacterium]